MNLTVMAMYAYKIVNQFIQIVDSLRMWGSNNPHQNININPNINSNNALQQLKSQVVKAKSYKPKLKDIQTFASAFQKYFSNNKYNFSALDQVIQYFVEIYHSILHLSANTDRMAECFRKFVYWVNGSNLVETKPAYLLIKAVVKFCEKEFKDQQLIKDVKQKDKNEKNKSNLREPSKTREQSREKSRQPSAQNDRKDKDRRQKQTDPQTLRSNLKAMLSLVRKAGDKNMLKENVYQKFVEYYLHRIQKSIQIQQGQQKQTSWHILSALSTFLAVRNKTQVSTIASYHINRSNINLNSPSGYVGVYFLMQLDNIQDLIGNSLIQCNSSNGGINCNPKIVQFFNKSMQSKTLSQGRLSIIIQMMVSKLIILCIQCYTKGNYSLLNHLYKLYPSGAALQNSQQLIDRLTLHLSIDRSQLKIKQKNSNLSLMIIGKNIQPISQLLTVEQVNQQISVFADTFMKQHREYIQSTSIRATITNYKSKNIMRIQYVVKSYIFGVALLIFNRCSHQVNKQKILIKHASIGINKIIEALQKQNRIDKTNNQQLQRWQKFCSKIYSLAQDYVIATKSILNIRDKNEVNQGMFMQFQLLQGDGLAKYQKALLQWKQLIQNVSDNNNHNNSMKQQKKQRHLTILKQKLQKVNNQGEFLENWKIAMQAMFQINLNQKHDNKNNLQQQWQQMYSKQALTIMSALSITPSSLPKPSNNNKSYLILTSISQTSIILLQQISKIAPKQQLLNHIKKLMQENFDRVDQQIIRDVIVKNIFYSKCLLMTGHPPKCKFLMELVTREIQGIGKPKQQRVTRQTIKYLKQLLPVVPQPLLIDYCKYIANRDKLQFRMALFQKQQLEYQFLLQAGLFDVVLTNNEQKNIQ